MTPPRPTMPTSTMRTTIITATLATTLAACAVNPADMSTKDPLGMGAAIARCLDTKADDRTFPDWFVMFGPGVACR